jgi:DNA transformation protein
MNDSGFVDHCLELLSPLGSTRANRMFGGHGLYIDDLCVALIIRDVLYLKVDDPNRAAFVAAHCKPFTYEMKNGQINSLGYYSAPEEAMESPHEMIPWARRALSAAVAARKKAPAAPKAKPTPRSRGATS